MKKWMVLGILAAMMLTANVAEAAGKAKSDDLFFEGTVDIKSFNMTNESYGETSNWYFYPTYRATISKYFAGPKLKLLADLEKPGYASATYPIIKVNELYARFQEQKFYLKLGRQVFGDKDDLLLGLQNDAVSLGWEMDGLDLMLFLAKTDIPVPWSTGGTIGSIMGVVPKFDLGKNMSLDAKLLLGNEDITVVTSSGQTEDKINTLVQTGGRFSFNTDLKAESYFNLIAQAGLQFAMARTTADQSIDATGMGIKLDATYGSKASDVGFEIGGHLTFTSGDPEPAVNTKAGFASGNILPEAGPGMFSKIENGAGVLTFLDGHLVSPKLNSYQGVLAFGLTGKVEVGAFVPGAGIWFYSDTDNNGKSLGMELNQTLAYHLSKNIMIYENLAYFIPNREGLEQAGYWTPNPPSPSPAIPDPEAVLKFLIGTAVSF